MKRVKILHIVGARPNFMKLAPVLKTLKGEPFFENKVVHTGQHYDPALSDQFFSDLKMERPEHHLEVGSGSHAAQTAKIMLAFEKILLLEKPNGVMVYGDVNSTIACALVAAKEGYKVIHVEAGLRSFDWSMPEEINRVLTDQLSDILLTTSPEAEFNLHRENVKGEIFFVGNVMIDTLLTFLPKARDLAQKYPQLEPQKYGLMTLHRPGNVDEKGIFEPILNFLKKEAHTRVPLIFPAHPRSLNKIKEFALEGFFQILPNFPPKLEQGAIYLIPPQGYLEMLFLTSGSFGVYTDSGGLQEETTALKIPCLTLRENTERPVTVTHGSNLLAGNAPESFHKIEEKWDELLTRKKSLQIPPFWDGKSSERICAVLKNHFSKLKCDG